MTSQRAGVRLEIRKCSLLKTKYTPIHLGKICISQKHRCALKPCPLNYQRLPDDNNNQSQSQCELPHFGAAFESGCVSASYSRTFPGQTRRLNTDITNKHGPKINAQIKVQTDITVILYFNNIYYIYK